MLFGCVYYCGCCDYSLGDSIWCVLVNDSLVGLVVDCCALWVGCFICWVVAIVILCFFRVVSCYSDSLCGMVVWFGFGLLMLCFNSVVYFVFFCVRVFL